MNKIVDKKEVKRNKNEMCSMSLADNTFLKNLHCHSYLQREINEVIDTTHTQLEGS